MRRVVITGLGAVTPIGNTVEEMWQGIKNGACGIGPITQYDATGRKVTVAAEVKNLDFEPFIEKRDMRKMDRFTQLAMVAAQEAMESSNLNLEQEDTRRMGVLVSSGIGGLATIEKEQMHGVEKGFDRVSPYFIPMSISNMAAGQIAMKYGLHGMCSCVVTACASSTNAIGDAYRYILHGYGELMLCGGSESAITPLAIGGFTSLKALSTSSDPNRASIPFDKERNGFVMGEGAGMLVLEEYEHAKSRGAKIYGELAGYGANCDAHHITAPLPDGSGAAECMKLAMESAGIEPQDVDYINAHGTATPMNDKCETLAVKTAFGDSARKLMISSTKSMTGHLLGGSGAVEAVITTKALEEGFVPATIHHEIEDEDCDLDIVANKGRKVDITYALSNSLGFGGHNATLVLKKFFE